MYTFEGKIRYSETDSEGKLTMASLINYFQDTSTFQSEALGVGVQYMRQQHQAWVLSSWQIEVERYPSLCERVAVGTLPYEMKGFLGYRNFCMLDEEGEFLAKANSLWSLLNTDTGKPCPVPEEMLKVYRLEPKLEMEYQPRKIQMPEGGEQPEAVTVKRQHLDTNRHVNNQQFVNIAMSYLPEGFCVRRLRAEYKKQAFLGDVLVPYLVETEEKIVVALRDEAGAPYMIAEFGEKRQI